MVAMVEAGLPGGGPSGDVGRIYRRVVGSVWAY